MKHIRWNLMLVLPLVLVCTRPLAGQAPAQLKYGYAKGNVYLYADTVRMNLTQEMMGQEMKIVTSAKMTSRVVVENVSPDGKISLITSLDSLVVSSKSPRRDTTMVMNELIGKKSRVTILPDGKVLSRETIDTVQAMAGMLRSASFREAFRLHRFSDTAVAVGGTWKSKAVDTTEAMGGAMVNTSTLEYTLVSRGPRLGRECCMITYAGDMAIEGKGAMMGMEFFTEGKGKVRGTLYFDDAAGIVVTEESLLDTDVTAAITGQQNMTIPMTQSSRITRSLLSASGSAK